MKNNIKNVSNKLNIPAPKFSDIKKPEKVVCLLTLSGAGTKLLHSYFDGHPALYSLPCYPLLYFYCHWDTWRKELAENWNWEAIIDTFCIKHASVLDSRKILGMNGLNALGDNKDGHIEIDEKIFKYYLTHLLEEELIERKTFLFAVHYAYSLCRKEDLGKKQVLFWHHHDYSYLEEFIKDVPDAIVIGLVRDFRAKIYRNIDAFQRTDEIKLRPTDVMACKSRLFKNTNNHILMGRYFDAQSYLNLNNLYVVRHEDLAIDLEGIMRGLCKLMNIKFRESLLKTTFDGKLWWGHAIYNMPQVTGTYKRVLSKEWQTTIHKIELYVIEGIVFNAIVKYDYEILFYRKDSLLNRILLIFAILLPFKVEWQDLFFYINPITHIKYLKEAYIESSGKEKRKDYTHNATHRYKWTYFDLNLWEGKMV